MATYLAHINVMLRPLVNDPQGLAVRDGLHALGFDHEKLTYRYNGRDFRLTDVYGSVVKDVLKA